MPPNAVYVGRPTKWGNPFRAGDRSPYNYAVIMDAGHACDCFRRTLEAKVEAGTLEGFISPLRGKDLACWCPLDKPCHADILLEFASQ